MAGLPWGESSELRERRLPPGPQTSKEEVERNHRERLSGTTVAVTAEKGYAATSVTDLVAVAGMSRSAFYTYFENKEDCFLATLDAILDGATAITAGKVGDAEGLVGSIEAGLLGDRARDARLAAEDRPHTPAPPRRDRAAGAGPDLVAWRRSTSRRRSPCPIPRREN